MRILHTIPGRNWGGMEHRTIEQVRWLVRHGHDVWLAAPADGEPFRRAQALGLPVVDVCFDPPWHPRAWAALRRLVRQHGIDVLDAHYTRDAKAALACLDLCAVVRSRHVNQPLKTSWARRRQWRAADHIITVADCTRDHLVEIGLADPARVTGIGGWADEPFFTGDAAGAAAIRAGLNLAEGTFVLVCVAMLRPDKGQDHLIAALDLLARRGIATATLLAGSATAESAAYAAGLHELVAKTGLDVHFLGYRDDIPALMGAADCVVIPSLTEAQPRVAVQAFATGRPVVASAVGGVPEIVHDGVTGWLVPAADAVALADAIARVIGHPDQAAAVAANAHDLAERSMRFDRRMEQTLATYETAIAHARARAWPKVRG